MQTSRSAAATKVVRGHKGLSAQELIHRDGRPVPPIFAAESPAFLGDEDIPFARYTDQAFFDREMDRMWTRTWQWACREEHIPEPGDYYVYEIGAQSVIVLRDEDGLIQAYVNSCLHRGTKFRRAGAPGCLTELRCPFHGWTWALDGKLKRVPSRWDVPHIEPRDFSLPSVATGLWGGFVFINLDPEPQPFEEYIAPIPAHFANFRMADRHVALHVEKELHCNWKAAMEAFLENYHTRNCCTPMPTRERNMTSTRTPYPAF